MTGRALRLGTIAVLLALAGGGSAAAQAPSGPRLAFSVWNGASSSYSLVTANPRGDALRLLAGGHFPPKVVEEAPFAYRQQARDQRIMPIPGAPSWSPDGRRVLFAAWLVRPGKRWRFHWPVRDFLAAADGSGLRSPAGLAGAGHPIFAPDGRTIVFARGRAPRGSGSKHGEYSLWSAGLDGSNRARLTPWRYGVVDYPSSISPDGTSVAVTRVDERRESALGSSTVSAVEIPVDGGPPVALAENAADPVFSPDGTRVAFTRYFGDGFLDRTSSLFVAAADGSAPVRLTSTDQIEDTAPSWDPSGQRIAFAREDQSGRGRPALSIEQINSDGTCEGTLFREPGAILIAAPAWQPGPGREAGPISC